MMFADSGDDHESRLIPSIESVGIAGRTRAGSRVAVAFRRAPLKPCGGTVLVNPKPLLRSCTSNVIAGPDGYEPIDGLSDSDWLPQMMGNVLSVIAPADDLIGIVVMP